LARSANIRWAIWLTSSCTKYFRSIAATLSATHTECRRELAPEGSVITSDGLYCCPAREGVERVFASPAPPPAVFNCGLKFLALPGVRSGNLPSARHCLSRRRAPVCLLP
jgi:hypothetical protein